MQMISNSSSLSPIYIFDEDINLDNRNFDLSLEK